MLTGRNWLRGETRRSDRYRRGKRWVYEQCLLSATTCETWSAFRPPSRVGACRTHRDRLQRAVWGTQRSVLCSVYSVSARGRTQAQQPAEIAKEMREKRQQAALGGEGQGKRELTSASTALLLVRLNVYLLGLLLLRVALLEVRGGFRTRPRRRPAGGGGYT